MTWVLFILPINWLMARVFGWGERGLDSWGGSSYYLLRLAMNNETRWVIFSRVFMKWVNSHMGWFSSFVVLCGQRENGRHCRDQKEVLFVSSALCFVLAEVHRTSQFRRNPLEGQLHSSPQCRDVVIGALCDGVGGGVVRGGRGLFVCSAGSKQF